MACGDMGLLQQKRQAFDSHLNAYCTAQIHDASGIEKMRAAGKLAARVRLLCLLLLLLLLLLLWS